MLLKSWKSDLKFCLKKHNVQKSIEVAIAAHNSLKHDKSFEKAKAYKLQNTNGPPQLLKFPLTFPWWPKETFFLCVTILRSVQNPLH